MVATPPMIDYCKQIGIKNLSIWSRGVDTSIFKPVKKNIDDYAPIRTIYVGRVSAEKNIEAYLKITGDIEKTIIGDGPQLDEYKAKYPDVNFLGRMSQSQIANELPMHEVFVFPSLTDTFGLVILEAMACGLSVVAYRNEVNDYIIQDGINGVLVEKDKEFDDFDIMDAYFLPSENCVKRANEFSWEAATDQFIKNLI